MSKNDVSSELEVLAKDYVTLLLIARGFGQAITKRSHEVLDIYNDSEFLELRKFENDAYRQTNLSLNRLISYFKP